MIGGELLVELKSDHQSAGKDEWINTGSLGNFTIEGGSPALTESAGIKFVSLDRQTQYIGPEAPDSVSGLETRTIEAWVKNDQIGSRDVIVSWGKRGQELSSYSFRYGSNEQYGGLAAWGAAVDMPWSSDGGMPEAGKLHHLVITYDGTTSRLYANGTLLNSRKHPLDTFAKTKFLIGGDWQPDEKEIYRPNVGTLDYAVVRIHSDALTPEQVAVNFEAGPLTTARANQSSEASDRTIKSTFEEVLWTKGWHQAKLDAEAKGGRLAILDSVSKQQEVERLGLSGFVGAKDEGGRGDWRWIDGKPLEQNNWAPGQPDRLDQEFLYVQKDGKWDDRLSNQSDRYILERFVLTGFVGDRLQDLTDRWKSETKDASTPMETLKQNYKSALERLIDQAIAGANAELALAANSEVVRIDNGEGAPPLNADVLRLWQTYEKHRVIEAEKAAPKLREANLKHFEALKAMATDLTKAGLTGEARIVEAERQQRMAEVVF